MEKRIQFASIKKNTVYAEKFVDELAQHYNFSEEMYANILVTLIEAVTNAIIHGNGSDENKMVVVESFFEEGYLILAVTDEGNGFDYRKIPDPTTHENIEKPNGRGIFLMHKLTDELRYQKKGREVCLFFKIS